MPTAFDIGLRITDSLLGGLLIHGQLIAAQAILKLAEQRPIAFALLLLDLYGLDFVVRKRDGERHLPASKRTPCAVVPRRGEFGNTRICPSRALAMLRSRMADAHEAAHGVMAKEKEQRHGTV